MHINGQYIFEWIIVDDGSTDDTRKIIEKWIDNSDFPILYKYQKNKGKANAIARALDLASGELFLIADSDDAFLPETFETLFSIWNGFDSKEKEMCHEIAVLCIDQYGRRIGCDFPITNTLIPTEKYALGFKNIGLGETWAAIKTENMRYGFQLPDNAKKLKFIPESYFWSKMAIELNTYTYCVNKILRVYYVEEKNKENLSSNIRFKYPDGFLFESCYYVKYYYHTFIKYPISYLKHLLKCIVFPIILVIKKGAK